MSDANCCPACGDSPLSTTGNIAGILTFAYALLASFLLFLAIIGTADSELEQLSRSLHQTSKHIETLDHYFAALDGAAHPDLAAMKEPIIAALVSWRRTYQNLTAQVGEYKKIRSRIRRCLRWWWRQKELQASVATMRSEKDDLSALLLTHLSMYVTISCC